jgi:glutamate 5-kinase
VRYGSADATRIAGVKASEIAARLGHHAGDALVHKDDLVVL